MKRCTTPLIRWTPALRKLKAISIRQPWAWLIVNGYKDIENRIWATNVRCPVLIHAGASTQDLQIDVKEYIERKYKITTLPDTFDLGGIIGVVDIANCVRHHPSQWFRGPFGWVLANPRQLPFKPCTGKLKFFNPDL